MSPMHQQQFKPYWPIMLVGFVMLMFFTRGWILWPMFFFFGWMFFSRKWMHYGDSNRWHRGESHQSWGKWGWGCESDSDRDNDAKRKNEDLYADFDATEKAKRDDQARDKRYIQTPDGEWIEVV